MYHVIDDDDAIREFMQELLSSFNKPVMAFSSAENYLKYFFSEEYSAPWGILSDVRMPGINGYELMNLILKKRPEIKFLMISGESSIRAQNKNSACAYLQKPFQISHLDEILTAMESCSGNCLQECHFCRTVSDLSTFDSDFKICPKYENKHA